MKLWNWFLRDLLYQKFIGTKKNRNASNLEAFFCLKAQPENVKFKLVEMFYFKKGLCSFSKPIDVGSPCPL